MMASKRDVDSGWAWVILVGNFLSMICHACLLYGVGVIHVELLHQFQESDTYTSLAGSLFSSLLLFLGPVATSVINHVGCRMTMCIGSVLVMAGFGAAAFSSSLTAIIITYGLVAGIGDALHAMPPYVCLTQYFKERYNLAVGVTSSGAGIGMLLSGPLFRMIFHHYDIHGAFLLLAGFGAQQFVFGFLMRPNKEFEIKSRTNIQDFDKTKCRQLFDYRVFKYKSFVLTAFQYVLWNISFSMLILHLPNFAVTEGYSEEKGAFLIFIVGLTGTLGRFFGGLAVGPYGINPLLMNVGMTGILSLTSLTFPLYSSTYLGKSIFATFFGFYNGSLISVSIHVLIYLLGFSRMSTALGVLYFLGGFGYIVGPILAAFIIDTGGSYQLSFIVCGFFYLSSMVLTLISTFTVNRTDTDAVLPRDKDLAVRCASGVLYGSSTVCAQSNEEDTGINTVNTPLVHKSEIE